MATKDLGKSTKQLALSALTAILGQKPTLTRWEETNRKKGIFMLPVPDDGRRELFFHQKTGICVEFTATVMLPDKEVPIYGCCIFKTQEGPPVCHQTNSILLKMGDAEETLDFYAPSERDVFPIQGVPQT